MEGTSEERIHVLCLNGGSSSIKVSIKRVCGDRVSSVASFNCQGLGTAVGYIDCRDEHGLERITGSFKDHSTALHAVMQLITGSYPGLNIAAVGHRVAHGGKRFTRSVLIDGPEGRVLNEIQRCSGLAPLHNPVNHRLIMAALADPLLAGIPHAAVFDTQFHAGIPDHAACYAVPKAWITDHDIRRYGFHGTSYAYILRRYVQLTGRSIDDCDLVIAHLGNGCSMAKIHNGISCDTSMGVTPLEGLVMGTRSGDVDPGLISLMAERLGKQESEITHILNHESGVYGLYGKGTKEVYEIRQAAEQGDRDALLVLDVVAYRIASYFCSYLGTLKQPQAIVFTGGVGEHEGFIRRKVLEFMPLFSWEIDEEHNALEGDEVVIAHSALIPSLQAWVIPTDEEHIFALEAAAFR
ncbi:MAG: acetate/propionate family kinase [Spirochaetia bacterium]|nr:acetate/propionate family kinase [Spirochaetia bacterium]